MGNLPGEVGNGQARDITEGNLLCAGDAGKFLYLDKEGQQDDGAVRDCVTDLTSRYELPVAALNARHKFSKERAQFPGWFPADRERREMPHF